MKKRQNGLQHPLPRGVIETAQNLNYGTKGLSGGIIIVHVLSNFAGKN
jgi:hypothetical protein